MSSGHGSRVLVAAALATALLLFAGCATAPRDAGSGGVKSPAAGLIDGDSGAAAAGLPTVTSFEAGVAQGDDAWRRRELDLAVYLYVQALGFREGDAETLAKIGSIHESRGNLPLARQAFEMAIERNPRDARIAERLGLLCLRIGDDAAAQKWLESAENLAPDRPRTLEGLGTLALRRKDYGAAIDRYTLVLAREPVSPVALAGRGQARLLSGQMDAAEVDLRAALAQGDSPAVRRDLGTLYGRRGRYAEALAQLLTVMPEAEAYFLLGEIAQSRDDLANAERLLEKAIAASPTYYPKADRSLLVVRERLASSPNDRQLAVSTGSPNSAPPLTTAMTIAAANARATSSVRVREAQDLESAVQGYLQAGDAVRILEPAGEWTFIEFTHRSTGQPRQGWVRSSYLDTATNASARRALP
jgi:tetratricopeptide (TPR) repeat protein